MATNHFLLGKHTKCLTIFGKVTVCCEVSLDAVFEEQLLSPVAWSETLTQQNHSDDD